MGAPVRGWRDAGPYGTLTINVNDKFCHQSQTIAYQSFALLQSAFDESPNLFFREAKR